MKIYLPFRSLLQISLFTALSLSTLTACPEKQTSDDSSQTKVTANTEASTPEEKTAGEDMPAASENLPQSVNFTSPENNAKVKSPVKVIMQVQGMKVEPAGQANPNSGHHHLTIDGESTPEGEVVAADATHIHFGKGQTETEVELSPGKHTLTLQFANGAHLSYGPDMSQTITVEVIE